MHDLRKMYSEIGMVMQYMIGVPASTAVSAAVCTHVHVDVDVDVYD